VTGIVDEDIDPAAVGNDLLDRSVSGLVRLDVELDRADVGAVNLCQLRRVLRVAARDVTHRCVDGVAGAAERFGGHSAKAAGRAGDEDDRLRHFKIPFVSFGKCPVQMIPPLARRTWPLIQAPSGPARKAMAPAMSSG